MALPNSRPAFARMDDEIDRLRADVEAWSMRYDTARIEMTRLRAINADLLVALECVANNRLSTDVPKDEVSEHDYAQGWDAMVMLAKAAIAKLTGNEHDY